MFAGLNNRCFPALALLAPQVVRAECSSAVQYSPAAPAEVTVGCPHSVPTFMVTTVKPRRLPPADTRAALSSVPGRGTSSSSSGSGLPVYPPLYWPGLGSSLAHSVASHFTCHVSGVHVGGHLP